MIPKTKPKFAILEPITFPRAKSGAPFKAAFKLTMSSGAEVAKETGQFFVNHKDNDFLNHTAENAQGWGYAVFGKVTEGMDVVDALADMSTGVVGGYQDAPLEPVTIESVTVSE